MDVIMHHLWERRHEAALMQQSASDADVKGGHLLKDLISQLDAIQERAEQLESTVAVNRLPVWPLARLDLRFHAAPGPL